MLRAPHSVSRSSLPWFGLLLLGLASCSQRPSDAALKVVVNQDPAVKATCVKIAATGTDGNEKLSTPIPHTGLEPLLVAVYRGDNLPERVTLKAIGYVGAHECDEPLTFNMESLPQVANFRPGEIPPPVTLRLPYADNDEDRDGYSSEEFKGPDCDDSQPALNPGAPELCGDGIDNNCRGGIDCADSTCDGQPCPGGVCSAGACSTPTVETNCNDGLDNDRDGTFDCTDPDCSSRSCLADTCTAGVCSGGVCGSPTPRVCGTPPNNECFNATGTCAAGQGCQYTPRTGQVCSNGGVCNAQGVCAPLLGYAPSNFVPPPLADFDDELVLDCDATFDSSGAFTANPWCAGQTVPRFRIVTMSDGTQAALIAVKGLRIPAGRTLRLLGDRPVIIAVFGNVQIAGQVAAGSAAGQLGAGSAAALSCVSLQGSGAITGGGGSGGSFGGAGGGGGSSFDSMAGGGAGTGTGTANLVPLRAGCPGGAGGGTSAGPGGRAGGALQISASGTLSFPNTGGGLGGGSGGKIEVGGAGGAGGAAASAGGGGGGSGGSILLEASVLTLESRARLAANGGGGGEGSGADNGSVIAGTVGEDGGENATAAGGGNGAGNGGGGGAGGAGAIAAAPGNNAPTNQIAGGGGGGGGSVGRIRLNIQQTCTLAAQAVITPPSSSDRCTR